MANRWGNNGNSDRFFFFSWAPKSLWTLTLAIKLNAPWKKNHEKPRQRIKKERCHFSDKVLYSQSSGFSSSHVWMWELDHKEGRVLKNWCFQTVVPEKALESSLDHKGIKLVNPKGNWLWIFIGRTNAEDEASIIWSADQKRQLIGIDPDAGKD